MQSEKDFADSFLGAQREAAASFGINTILLEKYITRPRHIEVQVVGRENSIFCFFYETLVMYRRKTDIITLV